MTIGGDLGRGWAGHAGSGVGIIGVSFGARLLTSAAQLIQPGGRSPWNRIRDQASGANTHPQLVSEHALTAN
jgi:hypothetical protein